MKEEILDFLVLNKQNNYFVYLQTSNSIFNERKEHILNILLQDLLQYNLLIFLENNSVLYQEIDNVLMQSLTVEEKVVMLKYRLFKMNEETYNHVIQMIQYIHFTFGSNKMLGYILSMAQMRLENSQPSVQEKAGKIGECLNYLEAEIQNLNQGTEHVRKMAC